jgi:hypothetical protein
MSKYIKLSDWIEKRASGDTTSIAVPEQTAEDMNEVSKQLAGYFEHKEGLAQNVKQELGKFFDIKDPAYSMRKQTLIDKVASVIK